MIVQTRASPSLNIAPFRHRVMLLRAWQLAGVGGCVGAVIVMAAVIGDRLELWQTSIPTLLIIVLGSVCLGAFSSLLSRLTDAQIARSLDRRSLLEDRLTTVFEEGLIQDEDRKSFVDALSADTARRLSELKASKIYPIRFYKAQAWFLALLLCTVMLYIACETTAFLSPSAKQDAKTMKEAAVVIQDVAKPTLDAAENPGATSEQKQLAAGVRKFVHDLSRGHMTKQEALIRANELADQARQLEHKNTLALGQSLSKAQTAGQQLQSMQRDASLQKTDEARMADEAKQIQSQMASLQNQLDSALAGKSNLSKAQIDALKNKIAALQQQLQQIQLSQQAAAMLSKLQSMADYQKAMELLSKLQAQSDMMQQGQSEMSPEQMQAMADQLDALAKEMDSDAKLKAFAQSLLEAAKAARDADSAGLASALAGAFSLAETDPKDAPPDMGENGSGSTAPGTWVGDHGKLNLNNKSSLLHVNFKDRFITSQMGHNGPESYTEEMGPAHLDSPSGVPYQAMLPKYEKSAESALSKGDIPPEMRTKVRDYFDSLHRSQ